MYSTLLRDLVHDKKLLPPESLLDSSSLLQQEGVGIGVAIASALFEATPETEKLADLDTSGCASAFSGVM